MNKMKDVILDKVHFFQNTRKTVFLAISELFSRKKSGESPGEIWEIQY